MKKKNSKFSRLFDRFSTRVTKAAGSPRAFIAAILVVIIWALVGPVFKFSETWQLIINTGTTILTFLMVFVIQQSLNKDTVAVHLKVNEILASIKMASNRMIDVEALTGEELEDVKQFYIKLSELAEKEIGIRKSCSIDDALKKHNIKMCAKSKTK